MIADSLGLSANKHQKQWSYKEEKNIFYLYVFEVLYILRRFPIIDFIFMLLR